MLSWPLPASIEAVIQRRIELLSPRAHEKGLEIAWAAPAVLGRLAIECPILGILEPDPDLLKIR